MPRKNTTRLLEMIDEGLISNEMVVTECLSFMSEGQVTEMMEAFIDCFYDEEGEENE